MSPRPSHHVHTNGRPKKRRSVLGAGLDLRGAFATGRPTRPRAGDKPLRSAALTITPARVRRRRLRPTACSKLPALLTGLAPPTPNGQSARVVPHDGRPYVPGTGRPAHVTPRHVTVKSRCHGLHRAVAILHRAREAVRTLRDDHWDGLFLPGRWKCAEGARPPPDRPDGRAGLLVRQGTHLAYGHGAHPRRLRALRRRPPRRSRVGLGLRRGRGHLDSHQRRSTAPGLGRQHCTPGDEAMHTLLRVPRCPLTPMPVPMTARLVGRSRGLTTSAEEPPSPAGRPACAPRCSR